MRVTKEVVNRWATVKVDDIKAETIQDCCFIAAFTAANEMAKDLLEARELIKEMLCELDEARTVMEKYEAQLTGELFNDPSLNEIIERAKEYAE